MRRLEITYLQALGITTRLAIRGTAAALAAATFLIIATPSPTSFARESNNKSGRPSARRTPPPTATPTPTPAQNPAQALSSGDPSTKSSDNVRRGK